MKRIKLLKGDITGLEVDAIVNAANTTLLGGGGVDGAIHRKAGPELLAECRQLNGCPTGESRITGGHRLKARYVIHTVGPVWYGGHNHEEEKLASCYRNSLELACRYQLLTVAFPNISTGAYHFPKDLAATIAIRKVTDFLNRNPFPGEVIFCAFDPDNFNVYRELLGE